MIMEKLKNKPVYIDENVAALTAYQVVLITVFGIYFRQQWLLFFLAFDFFVRAAGLFTSPLAFVAKKITAFLFFENKPVFAAPKRFAAFLGFLMSVIITFFYDSQTGVLLGFVLVILAAIESVFKICIGCCIYNYLVVPIRKNLIFFKK